ncbi:hypothetical protein ABZV31_37585 [Streptomyces sp. NPDC005202]|uniref:PIN-like domain-containing protein n=1 Tax=Streptomyces sp. NPDC005202 TaxID=3157021 RepID=UPI0033A09E81
MALGRLPLEAAARRERPQTLRILLTAHDVVHVHELDGWASTKDIELYAKAKAEGFQAIITNDAKQLNRPMEVEAIARQDSTASSTARTTSTVAWSASTPP